MENVPKDIIKISIPTEDPNEWRIFRGELAKLGITDENTVDTIQGLVSEMINKRAIAFISKLTMERE